MKIIQVTTFFHPIVGGVETQALGLARALKKEGHQVEVITSDSAKNKGRIKEKHDEIDGIKITRCKTWFGTSYFYKIYPGLIFKLFKKDFDIIHVHGFRKFEVYAALLVTKIKKKKLVVTSHNPFVVKEKSRGKVLNFFVKLHDITLGKLFSRYIDQVIAITKEELEFLEKFNIAPNRINVIPNGVSELFFGEGKKENFLKAFNISVTKWKNIVVTVGRIHKVKGFQNLKHAADHMKNTLFIIAGADDGYLSELKKYFDSNRNVILLERTVSHEQVNDMFALGDLFVMPSLHEAFGITLLEAMASGLPVISTIHGGPKEIVKESFGVLVEPEKQKILTNKIKWMLEDEKRLEKMGIEARKEAGKYRWKRIVNSVVKVYEEILSH
ncbi:MAG TPA: glycosyltransferase family 1 protein [bacterium]|nr:glycosyltransferase family 1 protein [bacterium]